MDIHECFGTPIEMFSRNSDRMTETETISDGEYAVIAHNTAKAPNLRSGSRDLRFKFADRGV